MKKKNKKKKIILIILIVLLIGVGGYFGYTKFFKEEEKQKKVVTIVDEIANFPYVLEDRDNQNYKDEYATLKTILEAEEIDYDLYGESISKLFIIDFYTLDNKVNKYDVGGLEFLHTNMTDNFKLKAQDTIYKYVEDDSYDDRVQDLPVVNEIEVSDIKEDVYTIDGTEVPAYIVTIEWNYVVDMGYDSKALLALVMEDKELSIVEIDTDL